MAIVYEHSKTENVGICIKSGKYTILKFAGAMQVMYAPLLSQGTFPLL